MECPVEEKQDVERKEPPGAARGDRPLFTAYGCALNYLGFRFCARLQSIHHIESAEIITNFHPYLPESPDYEEKKPYFLYKLGPPDVT